MAEEHSGTEMLGDIDCSTNDRFFLPASVADGAAPNNSIYFSTTAGVLVYKDAGGVVHNLY